MDFTQGKTAIDINFYPSLNSHETNNYGYDQSPKGKSGNFDWGITEGLGNKFAIQYSQFNPETKQFGYEQIKLKTQEANVLYLLDKNVAAFAGYRWAKVDDTVFGSTSSSSNKSIAQFGLQASTEIAKKTDLFGKVSVGNNLSDYTVGISYNLAPGLDANVQYRDLNIKRISFNDVTCSSEFKGLGYGLTYKF